MFVMCMLAVLNHSVKAQPHFSGWKFPKFSGPHGPQHHEKVGEGGRGEGGEIKIEKTYMELEGGKLVVKILGSCREAGHFLTNRESVGPALWRAAS